MDAVHPRARGEHVRRWTPCFTVVGSSPRSRGTFVMISRRLLLERFIPALAGNIKIHDVCVALFPVHPRARGEHPKV